MMRYLAIVPSFFIAATAVLAAAAMPPANELKIAKADFAGEGCPAKIGGKATFVEDGAAVALEIPAFAATLDGAKRLARTMCSATLEIQHPAGWQLRPNAYVLSMAGSLAQGVKGDVTLSAHYQGDQATAIGHQDVGGAMPKTTRQIYFSSLWSPCDLKPQTTLVITFALKAVAGHAGAGGHLDAVGDHKLLLDWRRCP